jgi:hypothetical protein
VTGWAVRTDLISCQNVLARSEAQFSRYIRHVVARERQQGWDVGAYPFRFQLFRYSPTVHVLTVGLSHMAVDRISAEILMRDLMRIYADTLADRPSRELPRQRFADSVVRQAATGGKGSRRFPERIPRALLLPTRLDVPPVDLRSGTAGAGSSPSLSPDGTRHASGASQADSSSVRNIRPGSAIHKDLRQQLCGRAAAPKTTS